MDLDTSQGKILQCMLQAEAEQACKLPDCPERNKRDVQLRRLRRTSLEFRLGIVLSPALYGYDSYSLVNASSASTAKCPGSDRIARMLSPRIQHDDTVIY